MILFALIIYATLIVSIMYGWRYFALIPVTAMFAIATPVLGFGIANFLGYTFNLGTLFYSGALTGLYMIYMLHGEHWALITKYITVFMMCVFLALGAAIQTISFTGGSNATYHVLFAYNLQVLAASFIAFYISWSALIMWVKYALKVHFCPSILSAFIGLSLVQILDSLIFYPLAFGGVYNFSEVIDIFVGGTMVKILFAAGAALFLPLVVDSVPSAVYHTKHPEDPVDAEYITHINEKNP